MTHSPAGGIAPAHIIRQTRCNRPALICGSVRPPTASRQAFLPGAGRTVAERLDEIALHQMPLDNGAVLETGCIYLVELNEALALPPEVSAATNPKSSTGRLDIFTRVITDGGAVFDQILLVMPASSIWKSRRRAFRSW
jgi:dCTP deaminase